MTSRPSVATAPVVYVVAVDASPSSTHVLDVACALGVALPGAAELHLVHVIGDALGVGPMMTASPISPQDLLDAGRLVLDRTTAHAAGQFNGKVVGHLASGDAWRQIVQMASSLGADLIVVGTAGKTGIARLALGSVAEQVVRHAGCPVLVARPKNYEAHVGEGIEPPCPDCVAVQLKTQRATLWCERHGAHHPHGRTHYELPPTFALGSMNFRP